MEPLDHLIWPPAHPMTCHFTSKPHIEPSNLGQTEACQNWGDCCVPKAVPFVPTVPAPSHTGRKQDAFSGVWMHPENSILSTPTITVKLLEQMYLLRQDLDVCFQKKDYIERER